MLKLAVIQPPPEDTDKVYEVINAEHVDPLHLRFIKSLLKLVKESWNNLSSMTQIPRWVENLYKTHGEDTQFLSKHPLSSPFIVDAMQNRSRNRSASAPTNK